MSVVTEIRNTQPNYKDKCELVIGNPCFNNRFYSSDLESLKSFTSLSTISTRNEEFLTNSTNLIRSDSSETLKQIDSKEGNGFNNHTKHGQSKKISALHYACSVGNFEQIKKSIEIDNYDPMQADQVGFYPLHYATMNNHIECVKLLLEVYGCQPNVLDKKEMTPLHHATYLGYVEIVKMLIEHPDIDLICKNSEGKTCINMTENIFLKPSVKSCLDLIKNRISQPPRKICVRLMDGSEIYLGLLSGSNTTVEQLHKEIIIKLGLDEESSHIFSLWICSKHLKLQLKSEHKPLQHLADWKRCIVSQLTNVDPLKEEPNLMFMRDAKCILKNEKKICEKISNPAAIRLLCFEAYHNYIHSMYHSVENQDILKLSVIFMKIVNETFKLKEWTQFFATQPKNIKIFVPIKQNLNSRMLPQEWIKLILNEWEKISSSLNSLNQIKLQFKFLSYCWNFSNYGSAYFQAAVPLQNFVHVCVNGTGIHLLNRQTRVLELFYEFSDISWRVKHSPDSLELYSRRKNQSIYLYTKQHNLINHLMFKLQAQLH